jgi:hypothetical protein
VRVQDSTIKFRTLLDAEVGYAKKCLTRKVYNSLS